MVEARAAHAAAEEATAAHAAAEDSQLSVGAEAHDDAHTFVQIQDGGSGAESRAGSRPTSAARSTSLPSRPASAGRGGGGSGLVSPAMPSGMTPRAPQPPVVRVSSASRHKPQHAPSTPRTGPGSGGEAVGSKLPALRLGGGGASVEQSVRAGEDFLRSIVASGACHIPCHHVPGPVPEHAALRVWRARCRALTLTALHMMAGGGAGGRGGPQQSPRPPLARESRDGKAVRPQSAREAVARPPPSAAGRLLTHR